MVYTNNLSNTKKDKLKPVKLDEQKCTCILCLKPFEASILWEQSTHFDHLDGNEKNHDPNNLAIVHEECNYIKKWNIEFQVRAMDWKHYLESRVPSSLRVREGEKKNETESTVQPHTQADIQTDELTDGQINTIINKLTKSQLEEQLPIDSKKQIPFSALLADIHYLTIQETGHQGRGSEPACRRALNGMTKSQFSPWQQKKLGQGNLIIQRRQIKKKLPEIVPDQEETIS